MIISNPEEVNMGTKILVAIAVLVLMVGVGAVSFYSGVQYGTEQAQNIRAEFFNNRSAGQAQQATQSGDTTPQGTRGQGGQGAQAAQFGRVAANGTVKNVNGNKIEVATQNGGSVMVTVDSSTQILKSVAIAVGDIQPGQRITVTSDQTGSNVTARVIQIREAN